MNNQVRLNVVGITELLESATARAAALVSTVRRDIESTGFSLYIYDCSLNLQTAHQLLSEIADLHAELERLIQQGGIR